MPDKHTSKKVFASHPYPLWPIEVLRPATLRHTCRARPWPAAEQSSEYRKISACSQRTTLCANSVSLHVCHAPVCHSAPTGAPDDQAADAHGTQVVQEENLALRASEATLRVNMRDPTIRNHNPNKIMAHGLRKPGIRNHAVTLSEGVCAGDAPIKRAARTTTSMAQHGHNADGMRCLRRATKSS